MKLTIRYENEKQSLELNAEDMEQLWISLSLEGEGLSQREREEMIQEAFEEQFNKPEYNNAHRFDRHRGYSRAKTDEDGMHDADEPLMSEVFDDRIFRRDEIERDLKEDHEDVCCRIRSILKRKPHWAEAFIAVRIDGMSVNDYTETLGIKDASAVSHWLSRAEKKIRENL